MRELPRQLTVEQLAELFEGRTRLVELLAPLEDPLSHAREVALKLSEREQQEVLAAHPAIGGQTTSVRSAREQGTDDDPAALAERAEVAWPPIAGCASSTSFFSGSVSSCASSRARPSGSSTVANNSTKRVRPSNSSASCSAVSCRGSSRMRTTR